jgi:hypothetical protein
MTGKTFYWLVVFETITAIEVPQSNDPNGFDGTPPVNQAITQRWNRSGTVNISPNQATEDVVTGIVTGCKEGGGIPADALVTNVVLLPNFLIPR